jgi:DNA replication and repair protein RecF
MRIEKIHLWNFRCYNEIEAEFSRGFNVITGLNGQGKTSILEAVYLLSSLKSFRASKNAELIRWHEDLAQIKGQVSHNEINTELSLRIFPRQKSALVNGKRCQYLTEYVGKMRSVAFSPNDLEIIKGAPELRRNWMDRATALLFLDHTELSVRYGKILQQRNRCLADFVAGRGRLGSDFEIWTDQLVVVGAQIINNRIVALREIEPYVNRAYGTISGGTKRIKLDYKSQMSDGLGTGQVCLGSVESISQILKEKQEDLLSKESILGVTLFGPHKDDMEFTLDNQSIRSFGSQGEVRSAALSLRMTEIELHKSVVHVEPILLVDDFSSELDEKRRNLLMEYLYQSGSQVFISTTEKINIGNTIEIFEGRIRLNGDRND